ncbi:replication protein A 70 kDa DNA-binding subunit B [Trifolium repens]|nr:replication protein A 70 kDa DNA-binding subunit B [Trifolium repens]
MKEAETGGNCNNNFSCEVIKITSCQASLLSLLPAHLLQLSNVTKLTSKALNPLLSWFHDNFHVKNYTNGEKAPIFALASALELREGSPEEIAALWVALFGALNLTARSDTMSRGFDAVQNVNDSKEQWKLAVRVEDLWTVTNRGKEHMEFLILDKQGDQIQPFEEILAGNYHSDLLVDIIGAVHEIKSQKQTMAGKKWPTAFSLKHPGSFCLTLTFIYMSMTHYNSGLNIIPCTLWGELGKDFMTHYNSKSDDGPMVIIIKHAHIKEPKGQFDLTISNAWTGTKLLLDPHLPQTFASPTQAGFLTVSGGGQSSQNSQASEYSVPQRYTFNAPPKHLSELMSCAKDEIVTTVGMPHHLMASKHGWFYLCCDHCSKSIITKSPLYTCSDPQHVTPDPKMKKTDGGIYNKPTVSEVAALIVGDVDSALTCTELYLHLSNLMTDY